MILLLRLFQIVFLDDFYKFIKKSEIQSTAQTIEQNINSDDLPTLLDEIGERYDVRVDIADASGNLLYSTAAVPDASSTDFASIFQKTNESGGKMTEILSHQKLPAEGYDERMFDGKNVPPREAGMFETLIYAQTLTLNDGSQILLLLNSRITPVDATVRTLNAQFGYIALILVGCALVLALIISKWVSRPIIKINQSAKKLGQTQYDVHFDDTGYKEIAELADTLNYAAKELSKVENLRRELIANISHDLRTPLTLITGYSEVMRDLPGENSPENIQIIIDEAKRLTTLVNDVMDISKLQAGTQELNEERFNLTESVKVIIDRFGKLVGQDGYVIDFIYEKNAYVSGDEVKIGQVVYNLINNALTYTGKDKKVTVRQTIEDGMVTIAVEDDGEGIPQDQLEYIWDRYYKVDKTHKRAATGTGLGLSIVKGILALHHAEYGVTSEVGKGSIFWFKIKQSQ